jgi:hypothetical protein
MVDLCGVVARSIVTKPYSFGSTLDLKAFAPSTSDLVGIRAEHCHRLRDDSFER